MHLSMQRGKLSLVALLASSSVLVQAGLLPKVQQAGHMNWIKRGDSAALTSKQDSSLLSPEPPAAEIAEVQTKNTQLARQAYANLARLSGGSAVALPADDAASDDAGVGKRAAMPQGVPDGASQEAVDALDPPAITKPNKLAKLVARSTASTATAFAYGSTPIRGVNLGGWLVLEPWITPSIFDDAGDAAVVDEYTYGQKYGAAEAAKRLKSHWDTWITENDMAQIASLGLNHVRIPIGFWAMDVSGGEPYPQGQYPYLLKAVGWAKNHGLRVIIDLHGAPGSQNGFDNSGRRGQVLWHTDQNNVNRTRQAIQTLLNDFYQPEYQGVVTSIELLNEPAGFIDDKIMDVVRQFYYDGYGQVRYPGADNGNTTASDLLVTIHDAFQPLSSWKGFMPSPSWQNVALDTHYYSIFNQNDLEMSDDERIQAVCKSQANLTSSNANLWTMVGEWTPANTDCARYLNGFGIGSRYDGTYPGSTRIGSCEGKTGNATTFSEDFKTSLGKYWEAQATVFEAASGWLQWAWKTEATDEWSYSKGVEYGWIPVDPTKRTYSNPC